MRECGSCVHFDSRYDEFRTMFDDCIIDGKRKDHFCPLYDDVIPQNIWYDNTKCPYYRDISSEGLNDE